MTTNLSTARAGAVLLTVAAGACSALIPWIWVLLMLFFEPSECGSDDAFACGLGLFFEALPALMMTMVACGLLGIAGLEVAVLGAARLQEHYQDPVFAQQKLVQALDPKALGTIAGGIALMGPAYRW